MSDDMQLNLRLRAEAAEWDDGEDVKTLLIEAADAIELLAVKIALAAGAVVVVDVDDEY